MKEPLAIPHGTQVMLRQAIGEHAQGLTGVVLDQPPTASGRYLVRFTDDWEVALHRNTLTILKTAEREAFEPDTTFSRYQDSIIYSAVVGSRAYGLDTEDSDTDVRGIYLPPASLHWSLRGVPAQIERPGTDAIYWELGKFLRLALNANPNVLEMLWSPLWAYGGRNAHVTDRLLREREMFLSKRVFATYNGYAMSQFKKLEQDLRVHGEIRWKHAMHLLRLLLSGTHILLHGAVLVDMGAWRDDLLAVRGGEVPWPEVDALRRALHLGFEGAAGRTTLPERPDYERADALLVWARREAARGEHV